MSAFNPQNERVKRRYRRYLREAQRYDEKTLDGVDKALARYESFAGYRDFKTFNDDQAVAFKKHLAKQKSAHTGKPISLSTLCSTLAVLRNFFRWLAGQPGFKSQFTYTDADYFNLPEKEVRVARAHREQRAPTMEQLRAAFGTMPRETIFDRRNRAVFAMAVLSGARDGALASLRLKHVDITEGMVFQDAREVKTKNSKTFTSTFFPVALEFRAAVEAWILELRRDLLWGNDDPLFPATSIARGKDGHFGPAGFKREPWSGAEPIRDIFRDAFEAAGLPYFNPHSIRKTLALLGEQLCRTPEEMKAWSQNLGHDKIQTTLASYGRVPERRQREIICSMAGARRAEQPDVEDVVRRVVREMEGRNENSNSEPPNTQHERVLNSN